MGELLGSFLVSVLVRTKHIEKTCVDLWGQSAILKAVWGVTNGIKHTSQGMMWFRDEPSRSWWACNTSAWWVCNVRG